MQFSQKVFKNIKTPNSEFLVYRHPVVGNLGLSSFELGLSRHKFPTQLIGLLVVVRGALQVVVVDVEGWHEPRGR